MRICNLLIENFRAIKRLQVDNLGDTVVVAGANGCGKTQIHHAKGLSRWLRDPNILMTIRLVHDRTFHEHLHKEPH